MKGIRFATAFFASIAVLMSSGVISDELADAYFSGSKNPKLTKQEIDAIKIVERWKNGAAQNIPPITGDDGSVQYVFGAQQISIVCAVLQVCDIALQPGENITDQPLIGDSARWFIEPALTGPRGAQIQHVIVKPLDVGLETTIIIPTDRRIYHLNLKSHRSQYMPKVSFIYPEVVSEKWNQIVAREVEEREVKTIPETKEYLGDLDFEYTLSGKASWKPVRVYNDGRKTIIQMPSTISQTEAPTLLVLRSSGEEVIVNYRLQNDRYIVDSVFDKAILIAGVGGDQDKVTITRASFSNSASNSISASNMKKRR